MRTPRFGSVEKLLLNSFVLMQNKITILFVFQVGRQDYVKPMRKKKMLSERINISLFRFAFDLNLKRVSQ